MGSISFDLPPKSLRANSRAGGHWATVHKDKVAYHDDCVRKIEAVKWGPMTPGTVPLKVVAYYGPGDRMGDLSDLGFLAKGAIDALVECGVLKNDSPRYLRPFIADCQRDRTWPRLVILWGKDALA